MRKKIPIVIPIGTLIDTAIDIALEKAIEENKVVTFQFLGRIFDVYPDDTFDELLEDAKERLKIKD